MLVECSVCAAPQEGKPGDGFATCQYCGELQSIAGMRVISASTPSGWRPAPMWTPPPQARIATRQPLRLRVPVRASRGLGAGCAVTVAALVALVGAGVAVAMLVGSGSVLRLFGGHGDGPPTLSPSLAIPPTGYALHTFAGNTGGSGSREMEGTGCSFGDYADAPQLTLVTTSPMLLLLRATSQDDVTVAVRRATGDVLCNDDGGDGTNARLAVGIPTGTSSIWVGYRHEGVPFQLAITARPVAAMPDADGLVAEGPALLGSFDVDAIPSGGHLVVHVEPEVAVEARCGAITTAVPSLIVQTSEPRDVTIGVSGEHDPVLVLRDAMGKFDCDDDGGDGANALKHLLLSPGATAIWAGFRVGGDAVDLTLDVHALPRGVVPDPLTGVAATAPPAWRVIDLDALVPPPRHSHGGQTTSVEGPVRSDVDGNQLGSGCSGRYSVEPSVVLQTRVPRHVVLTTTGTGDLVMAARSGEAFSCDDDSGGDQMARLELDLPAGLVPVWVGPFHGDGPTQAGLTIRVSP